MGYQLSVKSFVTVIVLKDVNILKTVGFTTNCYSLHFVHIDVFYRVLKKKKKTIRLSVKTML